MALLYLRILAFCPGQVVKNPWLRTHLRAAVETGRSVRGRPSDLPLERSTADSCRLWDDTTPSVRRPSGIHPETTALPHASRLDDHDGDFSLPGVIADSQPHDAGVARTVLFLQAEEQLRVPGRIDHHVAADVAA